MNINIDKNKAIIFLLREQYFSEFEVIDNLSQHPDGFNFYEWINNKEIIDENDNGDDGICIEPYLTNQILIS